MECNVGRWERVLRVILGFIFIGSGFFFSLGSGSYLTFWYLYIIGAIPLITGITGRCPLYKLLGLNTCE